MSHWKTFKSNVLKNTDAALLSTAMTKLGITLDSNIKEISNTWGREQVDAGFVKDGKKIALGFKFVDGNVELRGDFFSTGLNESTFMDQLSQAYQVENIKKVCNEQGWDIEEDSIKTTASGEIVMDATQWA